MKKLSLLFAGILLTVNAFAQAPNKMSYQTVIRNASNALVANKTVGIKISVLQSSSTGTAVYVETHTPKTNANGLASIEIGGGNATTGTFAAIDWSKGPYFIKTETDPAGGTAYTISATSELLSVPYAMYAGNGNWTKVGNNLVNSNTGSVSVGIDPALSGKAKLEVEGGIRVGSSHTSHNQGANLEWNKESGLGRTYLLNQRGLGPGGIVLGEIDTADKWTGNMFVDNNGVTVAGGVAIQKTTDSPQKNTVYGNSVPVAYGTFLGGKYDKLYGGYGVTSIEHVSVGYYRIHLQLPIYLWESTMITHNANSTSLPPVYNWWNPDATTIEVRCFNISSGTLSDSQGFSFVTFGTVQ